MRNLRFAARKVPLRRYRRDVRSNSQTHKHAPLEIPSSQSREEQEEESYPTNLKPRFSSPHTLRRDALELKKKMTLCIKLLY